ncbi:hypothetical protein HY025_01455 [Candidatus Daviesbacteria bacterium]|nr:hypothetical protein [Candidatus Daviesbacteria bacterium]
MADQLETISKEEARILKETEKIEEAEERIKQEEKEILESEQKILATAKEHPLKTLVRHGLSRRGIGFIRATYLKRLSKHRFIYALIVLFAIVLVWRGFWETTSLVPFLANPVIALLIGIGLLWILKKYTNLF